MGNAPLAELPGTESHRRVVEVMEAKDDRSSESKELANPNSKSGDDGSSIPNPLQRDRDHAHFWGSICQGHVGTLPGNTPAKFEVHTFSRFGAIVED